MYFKARQKEEEYPMRASGILMHISSLPSDYGIGTLGKAAYDFIDFLEEAKQSYWQILPVCPTSYGDSPYQSFSTHAGNPYFIDMDILAEEGLLKKSDYSGINWGEDEEKTDYSAIYNNRYKVLKKAYNNFKNSDKTEFNKFLAENENWISNYALFMSIKDAQDGKCWLEWEEGLKHRNPHDLWLFKEAHYDEVEFWEFLQFEFFRQWGKLKEYANEKKIKIIGDIPIYVALDSVDVWVYTDLFELDEKLNPKTVAGCPPDAFSETGQLWGNPIYDWDRHKETGYGWWIDRLKGSTKLYDVVRIDHFRGFDEYYAIPYGDKTAVNGKWKQGPGIEFFRFLEEKLGKLNIIAEDLGFLTPSVIKMLEDSGFPGMKVLEFAFDSGAHNTYLPHNHTKNSVVYAGTHDNEPIKAWMKNVSKSTLQFCKQYIGFTGRDTEKFVWAYISAVMGSVSDTAIIQMQDYLCLGEESRMNTPSIGEGNWQWRSRKSDFTKSLAEKIAEVTVLYGRI